MDVGTAKLPEDARRGIPHHLLDTLTVREPATVAEFQGWARDVIDRLRARRTTPVLVGGSALYTRAILDRFEFPGTDEAVRARLEQELAEGGPQALHDVLKERDPDAAALILPENGRRIVRALEVVELTGRPFSANLPSLEYADPHTVQIGVDIDRDDPRRAHRRPGRGDVRQRLRRGGAPPPRPGPGRGPHRTARDRLPRGGRPPARRAHRAGGPRPDAQATRRFARRQDSWFRKDPRIVWIRYDDPQLLEKAVAAVEQV